MKIKNGIAIILCLILTAVFTSACGGGGEKDQKKQVPQEVVIAGLEGVTGAAAALGQASYEAHMDYFNMVNEKGGINGKKIKYIMEDEKYDANVGVAAYKRIMKQHNPLAIWVGNTQTALALDKMINEEDKIPMYVIPAATSSSTIRARQPYDPYDFCFGATYEYQLLLGLKYIASKASPDKPAKVAISNADAQFARVSWENVEKEARSIPGIKIVEVTYLPMQAPNASSQTARVVNSGAEWVFLHGAGEQALIIESVADMNKNIKFVADTNVMNEPTMKKVGEKAKGAIVLRQVADWHEENVPAVKEIREYIKKKHPEIEYRDVGYMRSILDAATICKAIEDADKAGKLTREGVKEALERIDGWTCNGLTGPMNLKDHISKQIGLYEFDGKRMKLLNWTSYDNK